MALCSIADVRRVAKDSTIEEGELTPILEAVEEHVREVWGGNWGTTGEVTEKFYNENQDAILKLKEPDPRDVAVKAFLNTGLQDASGYDLEGRFDVLEGGRIRLRFIRDSNEYGYADAGFEGASSGSGAFPGASIRYLVRRYDRVEVTYTASGEVPARVREACALIGAATYLQRAPDVGGIKSETISSYSYTRVEAKDLVIPARARMLLRTATRTKHAYVF